jgi:hypothetical protein
MRHKAQRRELAGALSPARARMWRAMRMLKCFTVRELLAMAAVRRGAAEKFLRGLSRSGYLRGEGTGPARRYTMLVDTGPTPPRVGVAGISIDLNVELAEARKRHTAMLKDIRALEARIARLGGYVQRYEALGEEGGK